jgi:hypothetical protein
MYSTLYMPSFAYWQIQATMNARLGLLFPGNEKSFPNVYAGHGARLVQGSIILCYRWARQLDWTMVSLSPPPGFHAHI